MNDARALERLGPAVTLSVVPAVAGMLAEGVSRLVIGDGSWSQLTAYLALVLVWLLTTTLIVRALRARWTGSGRHATTSLFLASLMGLAGGAAAGALTFQWQDLMSQPYPTPRMVVLDLVATFSPLTAAVVCAWVVLAFTDTGAPGRAAAFRAHDHDTAGDRRRRGRC
jgi:hypothetical protein